MLLKNKSKIIAAIFVLSGIAACQESPQKEVMVQQKVDVKIENPNPFPFYKVLNIKEGYNFEVLSWGKGIDTLGGTMILMSDSLKNHFKSESFERKGIIIDAWNMDLDNDGNPEIYIQSRVHKNSMDLNVYEYTGEFSKISFPGINSLKGYEGNDKFFIKGGELFRTIPIVQTDSGKTNIILKTVKYHLSGKTFSSTEVKPE